MFSDKDLKNLIFPLFVEQFLLMFVGIADTFVVSFSSEADVSGVSLVTSFNTVLIFLFTALSSGGAVIISQYIGNQNKKAASEAASQLLLVSVLISVFMSALILIFRQPLLKLLFGKIEPDVMNACEIYLVITTLSLPALAVYDAGAALCRSIGKTEVTMYISKWSSCSRRCEVYDDRFRHADYRSTPAVFGTFWSVAWLGCDRCRDRYER